MSRVSLAALLLSSAVLASERSAGYGIVAHASPSALTVTAQPAGSLIDNVQVKVFSGAGALLKTQNFNAGGVATFSTAAVALAFGETVQVQANVRNAGMSPRTGVCTTRIALDQIGTAGGTIGSASGASLEIPFGALDSPTPISITETTEPPPAGAISPVYEFDPTGTLFARPVTVTLPVPGGTSAACIYFSRLDNSGYDAIGGTIAAAAISAQTAHLGRAYVGPQCSTRTVTGVGQITWLSASARISEPIDFGSVPVEALVPGGSIQGQGGLGTFTIPGVPVGPYILHSGQYYLVTSTNTPDLGLVRGGRPDHTRTALDGSFAPVLSLNLSGMDPWNNQDFLEFYSTEADDWDFNTERFFPGPPGMPGFPIQVSSTAITLPVNVAQMDGSQAWQIQGSLGDHALIAQISHQVSDTGVPYQAMTRVGQLPSFDLPLADSVTSFDVPMVDVSQGSSITLSYKGTSFVGALNQGGNPSHVTWCDQCGGFAGILAQAGDAQDGFYQANADPLLLNDSSVNGADIDSGTLHYGSPAAGTLAGNWGLIFDARWFAGTFIAPLAGSDNGLGQGLRNGAGDAIEWVTTPDKVTGPIVPPITLPTSLAVNGSLGFYAGAANVGLTPKLSWAAPATGKADFYTVRVRRIGLNPDTRRTFAQGIATLITADTSITLPAGILKDGAGYQFQIVATGSTSATSAAALATAPFKSTTDVATATASSALFWTGAAQAQMPVVPVRLVAKNQNFPIGLAANASAIFWAERGDSPWDGSPDSGSGRIWTAGLDGSNPHPIATGQHDPEGIAADASAVYWTNFNSQNGTIMRYDLASGAVSTVATDQGYTGGILDVNGSVYWFGQGLNVLRPGASAPQFLGWYGGVNLASDGKNLYWTDYGNYPDAPGGQVWRMPLDGSSAPVSLVAGQPQSWGVQVSGGTVFFSDQAWQQPFPASINRIDNGVATPIVQGNEIMKYFAVDAQFAYYVNGGNLYKAPLDASGAPTLLAPLPTGSCPEGTPALVGGNLYWTDTCGQSVVRAAVK